MICLILAAGYATRLYPLTENWPKPLLKVGEKTILDWLLDDLAAVGCVDRYVVISNHKFAGAFRQWARPGIEVLDDGTLSNETRLGAVLDIRFALDTLAAGSGPLHPGEEVLVIAGDNVLDFSLGRFIRYARDKGTSSVMRYAEPDPARLCKCGVMEVDPEDRIVSMEEKPAAPRSHWCCPPFYYYTREDARKVREGIAAGCGTDAPGSFMAWLSARVPVHAMEMPGRRYDIGNLESYKAVCETYKGITEI